MKKNEHQNVSLSIGGKPKMVCRCVCVCVCVFLLPLSSFPSRFFFVRPAHQVKRMERPLKIKEKNLVGNFRVGPARERERERRVVATGHFI